MLEVILFFPSRVYQLTHCVQFLVLVFAVLLPAAGIER
jgi:hypothetical protein